VVTDLRESIIATATPTGGRRFDGLSHQDAVKLEVQPARQLVAGLVEQGTAGVIAGLPETYKSWLAMQITFAVAAGGRVLGRDVHAAGPVAYWWQDDSTENELLRIQAYARRHEQTSNLPISWHLNEGLQLPGDIASLRQEIEDRRQVLAVFDSLYQFLPAGIGLKDETVADTFKLVKAEICDATGCTVAFVDHSAWPTESNTGTRAYGSVFKTAAIRWGIYLSSNAASLRYEARGNNLPRTKRTPLVFDPERLQLCVVDIAANEKAPATAIAEWVRDRPGTSASPSEIREAFDISDPTLKSRRTQLADIGILYMPAGKDSKYSATPNHPEPPLNDPNLGVFRGTPNPEPTLKGSGLGSGSQNGAPPLDALTLGWTDPDDHHHEPGDVAPC
jgi:AAA domain